MTRDLSRRAAAAQAAADAEAFPRCQWCAARVYYYSAGADRGFMAENARRVAAGLEPFKAECSDRAACHARVLSVVAPQGSDDPSPTHGTPETAGTGLHAPESSTTNPEGT